MRRLRERIESLREVPAAELLLRLRVVLVALRVDLVTARAEKRRGEQLRGRTQQADGEVDRRGRREAQLTRGRLARIRDPRRCLGACDIFWISLGDGRGMSGCVNLLRKYLFSMPDPHARRG